MRAGITLVMLTAVLVLLIAGCGGSGQEAAVKPPVPGGGSGNAMEIGPMVVQTAKTGNFKAESLPTKGDCTFVALYGAQIDYLASTAMLDRVVFVKGDYLQAFPSSAGVDTWGATGERCRPQQNNGNGPQANIYVCNLDGSGLVRLTNNAYWENTPRWSPDGTKIVFTRMLDDDEEIFVMNANGTGATQLTFETDSYLPDWSPDGRQLTFTRYGSIFTMNADGSNEFELPIGDELAWSAGSTWSPDGTKLALATDCWASSSSIATYDLYSGNLERLTSTDYASGRPAWDHSGKTQRIAYTQWKIFQPPQPVGYVL